MSKKKYYETAEFKKLQGEWEKKLQSSGFDDIEPTHDEYYIRPQEFVVDKKKTSGGLDYYQLCQQILREYDFGHASAESDRESFIADTRRLIFELHTEGRSRREISDSLKDNGVRAYSDKRCEQIIQEIKENYLRMGKR
jgi:hypothetical protein